MVRGKVEMKRIENASSRQVIALIIFSQKGRLHEFSSSNVKKSIQKYLKLTKEQHTRIYRTLMSKKIELLENFYRKLLGHNIGTFSIEELQGIDEQLERSLKNIRSRKAQLFTEATEKLQTKEKFRLEGNERLCEKIGLKQRHAQEKVGQQEIGSCSRSTHCSEVVTELFIGPPTRRKIS
ncbi:hypothetical protein CDL12_00987 [Handroanthus impetiginosus]|uniref:K-box domain-containing protein n=1 Tax=Handroanthus impetiginosus TaxID=429701 RepID=A0A2G9I927_9LAMI|nr:hypothetical protein CDL12_00987 [Handroanthus impetiginosus]